MGQSGLASTETMKEKFEYLYSYQLSLRGHFAIEVLYLNRWKELFPSELEDGKGFDQKKSEETWVTSRFCRSCSARLTNSSRLFYKQEEQSQCLKIVARHVYVRHSTFDCNLASVEIYDFQRIETNASEMRTRKSLCIYVPDSLF